MRLKASSKYEAEQMKGLQDQIVEEIKEMEHKKTEEALQLVKKEHDLWKYQNEKEKQKDCKAPRS